MSVLTVAQVNHYISELFEGDDLLADVQIRGEISNFKRHTSGHLYFTLKDADSQLRCVMFRGQNLSLKFMPEEGVRVVARGNIGIYEKRGEYQLYVNSMRFDGVGALFEAFEKLKQKLRTEGLFDAERKRPLPPFPRRIGIITSPTGAAVQDVCRILKRRFPPVNVLIIPALVQGAEAPASIVHSLELANRVGDLDLLIVGRGGGSLEDLWAFNDEKVARAASQSSLPLISAVGHETDFTILDFVADLRAPTPSAAAELAVPDHGELLNRIRRAQTHLSQSMLQQVRGLRARMEGLLHRRALTHPRERLRQHRQTIDDLRERMIRHRFQDFRLRKGSLQSVIGRLTALDPRAVLQRGYSIFRNRETGQIIVSATQASTGGSGEILLRDGRVWVQVEKAFPEEG